MYRIIIIPGFQQGYSRPEYRVDGLSCERIVLGGRAKKPVINTSVSIDVKAIKAICCRLDRLEWSQVLDLGKYNTVDDAELIVFIGEFGRVSIPLRDCMNNERLADSERALCTVLLDQMNAIEALRYTPTFDSPPSDQSG